nr:helix-turn-helix transcriptional regulator [Paucibacter sp. M5-1]MCZ7880439.1 helix-turn-helix transcriptional regulator [Paucibacter sp. M5-1]
MEASIERAHMGRIERGERVPNLVLIIKIANALRCSTAELIAKFEQRLSSTDSDSRA